MLDDQTIHHKYIKRSEHNSPVEPGVQGQANNHQQESQVNGITAETIDAGCDKLLCRSMRVQSRARFPEFDERSNT